MQLAAQLEGARIHDDLRGSKSSWWSNRAVSYIELTDEEESEINEQNNDDPDLDERLSSNPGNLYADSFHFVM